MAAIDKGGDVAPDGVTILESNPALHAPVGQAGAAFCDRTRPERLAKEKLPRTCRNL